MNVLAIHWGKCSGCSISINDEIMLPPLVLAENGNKIFFFHLLFKYFNWFTLSKKLFLLLNLYKIVRINIMSTV